MPESPPDSASEPPYSPSETNRSGSSIGGSPCKCWLIELAHTHTWSNPNIRKGDGLLSSSFMINRRRYFQRWGPKLFFVLVSSFHPPAGIKMAVHPCFIVIKKRRELIDQTNSGRRPPNVVRDPINVFLFSHPSHPLLKIVASFFSLRIAWNGAISSIYNINKYKLWYLLQ